VESLALDLTTQIKCLDVRVAAMVDKASLIPVKHSVNTKWEEFVVIGELYLFLSLLSLSQVVHVKEVTQTLIIVEGPAHITMLFGNNFALVLAKKGSFLDILHCKETPHQLCAFFYSSDLHIVLSVVCFCH
jgi:hypothetical protein